MQFVSLQSQAYDPADTVITYCDAVYAVSDFEGTPVVGDNDELGPFAQQVHSGSEPVDVCLIKRSIYLIEHAERGGADAEDGEHQGTCGQRALAS